MSAAEVVQALAQVPDVFGHLLITFGLIGTALAVVQP